MASQEADAADAKPCRLAVEVTGTMDEVAEGEKIAGEHLRHFLVLLSPVLPAPLALGAPSVSSLFRLFLRPIVNLSHAHEVSVAEENRDLSFSNKGWRMRRGQGRKQGNDLRSPA